MLLETEALITTRTVVVSILPLHFDGKHVERAFYAYQRPQYCSRSTHLDFKLYAGSNSPEEIRNIVRKQENHVLLSLALLLIRRDPSFVGSPTLPTCTVWLRIYLQAQGTLGTNATESTSESKEKQNLRQSCRWYRKSSQTSPGVLFDITVNWNITAFLMFPSITQARGTGDDLHWLMHRLNT